MALLIVVTGPPGAGKSTVARALATEFDRSALVEGDLFFTFLTRGAIAPWLPAAHAQNEIVTRAAAAAAGGYAAGGYDTVYDGVAGPWFLPAFTDAAGVERLHYAVLLPPAGQCLDQIAGRTGHGFTDQGAARHMHEQFASSAIDPRHVLLNPPGQASDTAREILRRTPRWNTQLPLAAPAPLSLSRRWGGVGGRRTMDGSLQATCRAGSEPRGLRCRGFRTSSTPRSWPADRLAPRARLIRSRRTSPR